MNLDQLLTSVPFYKRFGDQETNITGITMDSRQVKPGDLFMSIRGFETDGHRYIPSAIRNGAAAIVAEEFVEVDVPLIVVSDTKRVMAQLASYYYDNPTRDMHLIGVTGTNGKTTITYLLDEIFTENRSSTGVIGTIQTKINEQSYDVANTTPDSVTLHDFFHTMKEEGVDAAMMEVSSHALDQGRVYGLDFNIAVFTNLSQDHLDYHKDMDDYLRAKSLLFSQLGNHYEQGREKYAVVNTDDPAGEMLIRSTAQPVLTYGLEHGDIHVRNIVSNETGVSFTMVTPVGTVDISSGLMGEFSIYNMLAAAGAAIASGISLEVIARAFQKTKGVPGRLEPVLAGQNYGIVVDYAHTPDSLKNVLSTLRKVCEGEVRVVVGCGGDRDREKRPQMADIAMEMADDVYFTSDNPRSEDPEQILDDMTLHLSGGFQRITDRKQAIARAVSSCQEKDVLLIAGKGHETYQEIDGVKTDFDDRKVAKEAVTGRREET
ncbi:UDP-N-acetylmuramoyl-L-alanyl-D-glutamate--2,6-diaminopimelate ligase [Salimicrobium halophilum]|uniref:UDP-N-acetylmuramoyl-L-alanyl-D-glutamate--2,6-diaminopimelate ligase n=1 Tax=Salimicrobium halophilum TaxID=86666 RepID=A0A1G8QFR9_9BACI|nr:UDP-N-acetylmuramoyl-L-alanyl-D-glutamate--2,6-diaminopimelate ligase [Salimicrobium halophilum]SDJ03639.1 UDP-N-acetylmuramoylalanyl-D-glutamate--2,6-diaminopimelate ligase [Salimicrobium halophilum]